MEYLDFYWLRWAICGLSLAECARWLGVSLKTVQRWEQEQRAPTAAVRALRLRSGDLGELSESFEGFSLDVRYGVLTLPNGATLEAGTLLGIQYWYQELIEHRHAAQKKPAIAGQRLEDNLILISSGATDRPDPHPLPDLHLPIPLRVRR